MATTAAGAQERTDLDAYGPTGRSPWMDVDWRAHLRWVRVGDQALNVLDIGDRARPALVFLHGLSGCWQNWLENIPDFVADHRVIAIDLPGFGASPVPAEDPITIPGYARLVAALLDELGVEQARIVGNSMGGFVGAEMAIRFPQRIERLVLVASAGLSMKHARDERKRGLRPRLENVLFFGLGWLAGRSDVVARSAHLRRGLLLLVAAHPERLPAPLIFEQANGAGKPGFDGALDAMTAYPLRDRLGEIRCPTLIVWGEEDRLLPLKDASEFEWLIGDARRVLYADTGHMVMFERPARFNADLHAFLAPDPGAPEDWPRRHVFAA